MKTKKLNISVGKDMNHFGFCRTYTWQITSPAIPKTNLNLKIFHKEHEFEHEKTNAKSCMWDGGTGWVVAL